MRCYQCVRNCLTQKSKVLALVIFSYSKSPLNAIKIKVKIMILSLDKFIINSNHYHYHLHYVRKWVKPLIRFFWIKVCHRGTSLVPWLGISMFKILPCALILLKIAAMDQPKYDNIRIFIGWLGWFQTKVVIGTLVFTCMPPGFYLIG